MNEQTKTILLNFKKHLEVKRTGETKGGRFSDDFCEGFAAGKGFALGFIQDLFDPESIVNSETGRTYIEEMLEEVGFKDGDGINKEV